MPARRLLDLVESGELHMVEVHGWNKPGYIWHEAKSARSFERATVLSPFDPLVWNRDRAERLFGFRYRIEIYTPAPKRLFGYYVLPILIGEHLSGRLCMKADRQAGTLRVNAAWHEDGIDPGAASEAIAPALHDMSRWLDLERVEIAGRGNMAAATQECVQILNHTFSDQFVCYFDNGATNGFDQEVSVIPCHGQRR